MRAAIALALALSTTAFAQEQEKEVPKDSVRVTIPGCVNGRTFTVMRRERPEPVDVDVPEGRRFRLNGKKDVLKDMNSQRATMVEVTGLVRRAQVQPGGIPIAGGRIRIGGAQPQVPMGGSGPRPAPAYDEAVLDVESWRSLPDSCPARE
jgi:hypothetical protein